MEEAITLEDLYKELKKIEKLMVTRKEINRFLETLAIMFSEDTMEQIRKSEEDIKLGRIKEVKSVNGI